MTLKPRLAEARVLLAPGVYDALSALIAEQAGFEALYLSGASIAYTRLGRSDVGLTTYSEVQDTLARITDRVQLPVIVDADTGFGNALNVQRTVRGFERAGAAMVQLEDQSFPKRCGHLDGKTLVPATEMCGKLRAAVDARTRADTLILARTDAVAVEGFEAALDRAEAYLACGVDALFILRTLRSAGAAAGKHGRRRQVAGAECGRTRRTRLSDRDLPWRHGARGRACAGRLLREPAAAGQHSAVVRPDAGFRQPQRRHRHTRTAHAGAALRVTPSW
jgi:isocitrate lyase